MSGFFEPSVELIEGDSLIDWSEPFSSLSSPASGELDFVESGVGSDEAFEFSEVHVTITVFVSEFDGSAGNFFTSEFSVFVGIEVLEGQADNLINLIIGGVDAFVGNVLMEEACHFSTVELLIGILFSCSRESDKEIHDLSLAEIWRIITISLISWGKIWELSDLDGLWDSEKCENKKYKFHSVVFFVY